MTVFESAAALREAVGTDLGVGDWVTMTPQRLEEFAEATDLGGPTRSTTSEAPGFLTLSLLAGQVAELVQVPTATMAINYGVDDIRFPAPVPPDARLRTRVRLADVDGDDSVARVGIAIAVEMDGSETPVCEARMLAIYHFA